MSLRRIITALAATGHARPVPGSRALRALQRLPRIITALLLFLAGIPAHAQPRTGIVYWDLDHLYDTVPALFYNDTDYTPSGRLAWDTERYRRKIRHTAAVIDSMRMPLVALWGVENEAVVRLYDEPGRRYLYIEGLLYRRGKPMRRGSGRVVRPTRTDTIGLVLCSDTRMAEWVVRDLREERPGVKLLVAGRTSSLAPGAFGLRDALERPARLGRGNVRRRGGWQMRDRILADTALRTSAGDVYARRYLIDPKTGTPLPTYEKRRYRGGYGYALPVFVYLE